MNENASLNPAGMVNVGSGARAATLPLQQVQHIFHELTGKNDSLSKRYELSFRIGLDDLIQLHERLKQVTEQYAVQALNSSITVYFVDDTRQEFKSFESFRLMSAASTSCVEAVNIRYDLLIVPPITKVTQTFELEIMLMSRVAVERHVRESEDSPVPRYFHMLMTGTTSIVSVKHVDYTVARTLVDTVDRWLNSCPHVKSSAVLRYMKRNSHWIPRLLQYVIGLIGAVTILRETPNFLKPNSSPDQLAAYLLASLFICYGLLRSAFHLGQIIENRIDMYHPVSYVKLTRGDETEISNMETKSRHGVISGLVAFCAALVEAVSAKFIVIWLLALL